MSAASAQDTQANRGTLAVVPPLSEATDLVPYRLLNRRSDDTVGLLRSDTTLTHASASTANSAAGSGQHRLGAYFPL